MGVALLDLPWKVIGVMLAGTREYYSQQQRALTQALSSDFLQGMPNFKCLSFGPENSEPACHVTKGIMSVSVHFLFSVLIQQVLVRNVQHDAPSHGSLDMSWVSQCTHAGDLKVAETLKKLPLEWVDRLRPRKFGNVLPGEIATCKQVTCLLLFPYTYVSPHSTERRLAGCRWIGQAIR